jgi:hypothetical protein
VADLAVYFDAGAPEFGLPIVLVEAPASLRRRRLRELGLPARRAGARAAALRFGAAERGRADLRLDGRRPVAENVKKILALSQGRQKPSAPGSDGQRGGS